MARELGRLIGVAAPASESVAIGDFDGDGGVDAFLPQALAADRLLRNVVPGAAARALFVRPIDAAGATVVGVNKLVGRQARARARL